MSRQTGLTIAEILAALPSAGKCPLESGQNGPRVGFPICLLVNEIGAIFEDGKAEADEAEDALVELLKSPEQSARYIAHCYLTQSTRRLSVETRSAISVFMMDPTNAALVSGTVDA